MQEYDGKFGSTGAFDLDWRSSGLTHFDPCGISIAMPLFYAEMAGRHPNWPVSGWVWQSGQTLLSVRIAFLRRGKRTRQEFLCLAKRAQAGQTDLPVRTSHRLIFGFGAARLSKSRACTRIHNRLRERLGSVSSAITKSGGMARFNQLPTMFPCPSGYGSNSTGDYREATLQGTCRAVRSWTDSSATTRREA